MRMCCLVMITCLSLGQAADAGVVGGGGGPPALVIEALEFNRITADLLDNKKTLDLELQGLRLRPHSVDIGRLEINTHEVETGEAVLLVPDTSKTQYPNE